MIAAIKFRRYIANAIIAGVLLLLLAFTYIGGATNVFSSGKLQPYYKGDTTKANVSLMINVYWGTEFLEDMLKILEEEESKVTFFIGGMWAVDNDELLKKMYDAGHEIGNHGYFHKNHDQISADRNREEISSTHNLVKEILGIEMNLFAPPSGAFNQTTLEVAASLGYKSIMWTKDTVDWKYKDANEIYKRATKNPKNGDFVLMHPTQKTLESFRNIIKFYKEKGFAVTTVSQTLGDL